MSRWELIDWWGYVTLPGGERADTNALRQWMNERGLTDVRLWGGNFSFIAQDADSKTLALVVDACATVPLHWSSRPVFAHPDLEVVRDQMTEVTTNQAFVGAALMPGPIPTDETPFQGIHAVPPGCMVFLRPDGGHSTWHYFRPSSLRPHPISAERAVDLMSLTLQRAVADAVHEQTPAVHLSGGLDSGVVAALALQQVPVVGAYSWIGPDCPTEFPPVALTAAHLGLAPTVTDYGNPVGAWLREADPLLHPAWGMLLYESVTLALAAQSGATTVLSGWGGDDFASSGNNRPQVFLATGQWRELYRHSQAKARRSSHGTLRAMGLHRIGGRARDGRRFARRPSQLLAWRQALLAWRTTTWWKAGSRFGISYRYPLLDPRVVRLSCQLPAPYFAREGLTRWGFRQIAARLLPHEVAFRIDKAEPERVRRVGQSTFKSDEVARAHRWYPELDAIYQVWNDPGRARRRHAVARTASPLLTH